MGQRDVAPCHVVVTRDDDLWVAPLCGVPRIVRCLKVCNKVSVLDWHERQVHAQFRIFRHEDSVLVGKVLKGLLLRKQDVTHVVDIVRIDLLLHCAQRAADLKCVCV